MTNSCSSILKTGRNKGVKCGRQTHNTRVCGLHKSPYARHIFKVSRQSLKRKINYQSWFYFFKSLFVRDDIIPSTFDHLKWIRGMPRYKIHRTCRVSPEWVLSTYILCWNADPMARRQNLKQNIPANFLHRTKSNTFKLCCCKHVGNIPRIQVYWIKSWMCCCAIY